MTEHSPSKWYCDTCGGDITDPNMSLVTWRQDDQRRAYDYQVVHKSIDGVGCDPGKVDGFTSAIEVGTFLGSSGVAYMLSDLSLGPLKTERGVVQVANFDQFVDLFRRMQVPHYEEARRHFKCEAVRDAYYDANEYLPYFPDQLERIASMCKGCDVSD